MNFWQRATVAAASAILCRLLVSAACLNHGQHFSGLAGSQAARSKTQQKSFFASFLGNWRGLQTLNQFCQSGLGPSYGKIQAVHPNKEKVMSDKFDDIDLESELEDVEEVPFPFNDRYVAHLKQRPSTLKWHVFTCEKMGIPSAPTCPQDLSFTLWGLPSDLGKRPFDTQEDAAEFLKKNFRTLQKAAIDEEIKS